MKNHPKGVDERFRIAHKEAIVGIILVIINFILWFGFAYGLGSGNPKSYSYVLGLPSWFFYSCVLTFIIMAVLVILCVKFVFKDVPFEDEENGGEGR